MTTETETDPRPSIAATRKAITDRIIREAIASYHRAERAKAETIEAIDGDDDLEAMSIVAETRLFDAEKALVRAILNASPRAPRGEGPRYALETRRWPTRGVRRDGRLYVASPDKEDAAEMRLGEEGYEGREVMHLMVIDESDVTDVTDSGTLAADPADDEDDDEGPAEAAPGRRPRRIEPPPLPLARATMTFNSPSEPGFLTSIEVVVYDQCLEGQANTAAELGQAGWSVHSLGSMTIASRTAC